MGMPNLKGLPSPQGGVIAKAVGGLPAANAMPIANNAGGIGASAFARPVMAPMPAGGLFGHVPPAPAPAAGAPPPVSAPAPANVNMGLARALATREGRY